MNNILVFSNGCPRCKILKQKLDAANIPYILQDDLDEIMDAGFQTVPILKYKGEYYQFSEAVEFVQKIQNGEITI